MIWYVHVLYKTLPPEGIPNPMGPCIPFTTPLDHFHPNALSQHITDLTCTFMSHFFSFYHIKSPLIPINYNDMSIYPFITFQFLYLSLINYKSLIPFLKPMDTSWNMGIKDKDLFLIFEKKARKILHKNL